MEQPARLEYKVEKIGGEKAFKRPLDAADIEARLNERATDGWRLISFVPNWHIETANSTHAHGYLAVFARPTR